MNRRKLLRVLGASILVIMALAAYSFGLVEQGSHNHSGSTEACAKACADCLLACESCSDHCARLVASGKKDHLTTLQTCADCAELCGAAAKIVSRNGPLMMTVCEACARACDICGAACEKKPDDKHMQECAKACRDCAKACRQMIQQVGHEQGK
jgi:Domain of Unknown Function (DUF326)